MFQNEYFQFIRPTGNNMFTCQNVKGIKYLKRL